MNTINNLNYDICMVKWCHVSKKCGFFSWVRRKVLYLFSSFFLNLNYNIEHLYNDALYRNSLYLVIKGLSPSLGQLHMNKLQIIQIIIIFLGLILRNLSLHSNNCQHDPFIYHPNHYIHQQEKLLARQSKFHCSRAFCATKKISSLRKVAALCATENIVAQ